MVDDIFDIDKNILTLPIPGVSKTDDDIFDIDLAGEQLPEDFVPTMDKVGAGLTEQFYTLPERTRTEMAPILRFLAKSTDKAYDFSEALKDKPLQRMALPGGNIAYLIGQYAIGENMPKTFAKLEMGEPISLLDAGEAVLLGFDLAGLGALGRGTLKKAVNNVSELFAQQKNIPIEEASTIVSRTLLENPNKAQVDEYAGAKSLDELSEEELDKLNMGAKVVKPKKKATPKKTAAAPQQVEIQPGLIVPKDIPEAPTVKKFTDPLKVKRSPGGAQKKITPELNKAISKKIKGFDFEGPMDLAGPNPIKKIIDDTRVEQGYPPTSTGITTTVKRLVDAGELDEVTQKKVTKYNNKRAADLSREANIEKVLIKNTALAEQAVQRAKTLAINRPNLQMTAKTFYDILSDLDPKTFKPDIPDSTKRKLVARLAVIKPELKNFLAPPGKEVGGVRYDPETLTRQVEGDAALKRKELIEKFKENYPDEVVTDIYDPDKLLNTADKAGVVPLLQNPKFKFYEFLDATFPTTDLDTLYKNIRIDDPADLANPAQRMFNEFKKMEDVRKRVSPLIRPFLQRIFPAEAGRGGKSASVQIAHTFEKLKLTPPKRGSKKIGFDPEKYIGQGVNPDFLYLDISPYNIGIQRRLESIANKAGLQGDFDKLGKIQRLFEQMGVEGQQAGITLGKSRKLSTKLKGLIIELQRQGDPIPELDDLREAIKILESSGPEGYALGGSVNTDEDIFEDVQVANLKLPFWKLFTKPPVNETAPIPTPKEDLNNPTKKQKQSLEQEKINKQEDIFDPTPEDNAIVNLVDDVTGMEIATTPKTNQPITGVFYSDIERVLARPDTPGTFSSKKELLDFFRKNRIRDSEFRDYQIESLLRIYDENTPIPKQQVIDHLRQSPIRGMHVHATGRGSEIINPYGEKPTAYEGYAEPGYISGTQRERVLYIPNEKIPGDSGSYPVGIFSGESISNHAFGIPNQDDVYVVGWSRLTDRNAILPTKISAPKTASNIPGLTRERERAQRQVAGLFAEAINKLNREGVRRGLPQGELDELSQLSLEQIMTQYGDTLNQLSPGLLDQIDELIVKVRDIDDQITKGSNIDTSGIVRVAFADEIQSDIMQAAAARKQKLVATLRKIQDEGRESTTLPQLSRIGNQALEFFEENKSVFRPLKRSQTEVDLIGEKLVKLDAEVDEIINRYIDTRELDPASVTRLKEALTQNIDEMINELIVIDSKTYEGLFPDIPFKKREEWADALIKKDLFELAYRKFVLKEENVPEYYAVTPDQFVIDRYNFKGNSATPMDVRAADKKAQIDYFTARGEFKGSEYKGIGMSEFYGGPNAKTPDGKHYTSTIEKILKTQAKSNNSELVVLNVQTKAGAKDIFRITDQNGNMVATLSNRNQAETLINNNPNYRMERVSVPTDKNTTPSFAIKITEEMLEPYKTHKAKGGLVEMIDIFEVA